MYMFVLIGIFFKPTYCNPVGWVTHNKTKRTFHISIPHLDKAVELLRQIRPFYSCIHFVKSSQTLVKWAFQGTITNSLHTFLPYFKHFLRIFAKHFVGLYHIKPLIIMLYFHLFYGLNVVLPFDYLV